MRRLFRWALYLFIVLIALLVAAILLLDTLAKEAAINRIRAGTGMDVKIGKLSIGLLSPTVSLENFKLYNTAEFGGSPFLDLQDLHVEYDRDALRSGKLHFNLIRIDLGEVTFVKNKAGKSNFDHVKKAAASGATNNSIGGFTFEGIDVLNVSIQKARLTDFNSPGNDEEVNIPIRNEIFTNLHTAKDFLAMAAILQGHSGLAIGDGGLASPKSLLKGTSRKEIVKQLLSPAK